MATVARIPPVTPAIRDGVPLVAVIAGNLHSVGGIERYGRTVIAGLEELKCQVIVAESARWQTANARIKGVLRFYRATAGASIVWALHPRLASVALLVARRQGAQVIVSTYGFETWGRYNSLTKLALCRSDVVTVVSKYTQAMMGRPGYGAILLPPTFSFHLAKSDELKLPVQAERFTVSFVGRLGAEYKGLRVFAQIAELLRPLYPGWEFVAAGSLPNGGYDAQDLENMPINVLANPSDEELQQLFARSAIVVFPSRAVSDAAGRWSGGEGFGITLLDAALHGAAVVTSDEGACAEIGGLLGNAVVVRPSIDEVSEAVERLIVDTDARVRLGARGQENAARLFSPNQFRQRLRSVLEKARLQLTCDQSAVANSHAGVTWIP